MKKIILSFDYELFFGYKSGTVEKTLIIPTNHLLDGMDKVGAKSTFFVDYLMIKYMLEDEDTQMDAQLIINQLLDILKRGHRIELHLHPHWIDARYNGDGTWNFDNFTHYSLAALSQSCVTELFVEGATYLNALARKVIPDYAVIAFRAGGWAIQPFSHVKEGFRKAGIQIDSSGAAGFKSISKYSSYDFTNIPQLPYYRFSQEVDRADENGMFIEVPIATHTYKIIDRIQNKIFRIMHKKKVAGITDGTHVRKEIVPAESVKGKRMFTLSNTSPSMCRRKIRQDKSEVITFIDHPKDFTFSGLNVLKELSANSSFITYKDVVQKYEKR
ncbi:hypothetical protein NXX36_17255 [Bacteroides fragilis]|nr:hypothetical protein [Bacteroides fragilis]